MAATILPFAYPLATSYPAVTHALALISDDPNSAAPWICNNYIQLVSFMGKVSPDLYSSMLPINAVCRFMSTGI